MTKLSSPFVGLRPDTVLHLPPTPTQDASWHRWSKPEIDALTLAYAARRPLLVRGEPGTGKTQLARAAARALGWRLHGETIHPRFEPHELQYRFDAVQRLADAQAGELLEDRRYWRPGVLWKAYGWDKAAPYLPEEVVQDAPEGHVVLIDEIDKADSDLPNSLLEVLAQRSFRIDALNLDICADPARMPLILITTNEERDLPAAFLRRCIVLSLEAEGDYRSWLIQRGQSHFGALEGVDGRETALMDDSVLAAAAEQLVADRDEVARLNLAKPGLAEYLDLLYALHALFKDVDDRAEKTRLQGDWLKRLSAYGYLKHAVEDSSSPAHQGSQRKARMGGDAAA